MKKLWAGFALMLIGWYYMGNNPYSEKVAWSEYQEAKYTITREVRRPTVDIESHRDEYQQRGHTGNELMKQLLKEYPLAPKNQKEFSATFDPKKIYTGEDIVEKNRLVRYYYALERRETARLALEKRGYDKYYPQIFDEYLEEIKNGSKDKKLYNFVKNITSPRWLVNFLSPVLICIGVVLVLYTTIMGGGAIIMAGRAMKIKTEEHSGSCGHCHTAVPVGATVCTGCRAVWGLESGYSRQEHYDAIRPTFNFLKWLMFICLVAFLLSIFTQLFQAKGLAFMIGAVALSMMGIFFKRFLYAYGGILEARNGKVSWWRRS